MDKLQKYNIDDLASKWLDRHPTLKETDHDGLEMDAAVNEFGSKMPREQAEDEAYKKYVDKHREHALDHHHRGMKAAMAAGDTESARKHHMMYTLHAKALGHDPMQPPPKRPSPETASKVYKFKAHPGDMFAVHDREEEKAEKSELTKNQQDTLALIYAGAMAVLQKAGKVIGRIGNSAGAAPQPVQAQGPSDLAPTMSTNDLLAHHVGARALDDPEDQEAVKASLVQHHGLSPDMAHELVHSHGSLGLDDDVDRAVFANAIDAVKGGKPAPSQALGEPHYPDHKPHECGMFRCPSCLRNMPACRGGEGDECDDCYSKNMDKSEKSAGAKHCKCDAYHFPHRHGGGKCKTKK